MSSAGPAKFSSRTSYIRVSGDKGGGPSPVSGCSPGHRDVAQGANVMNPQDLMRQLARMKLAAAASRWICSSIASAPYAAATKNEPTRAADQRTSVVQAKRHVHSLHQDDLRGSACRPNPTGEIIVTASCSCESDEVCRLNEADFVGGGASRKPLTSDGVSRLVTFLMSLATVGSSRAAFMPRFGDRHR